MKDYILKKVIKSMFLEELKGHGFSPINNRIQSKELWIPMSDGIKLHALLNCPKGEESWPVILLRNPYIGAGIIYAGASEALSRYGYAVLMVDVRGTRKSEGEWLPFENDRKDGMEVIDWIANQDWCDGNIGTYGVSYLGHSQWCIADYDHPALKTMFISMFPDDPYEIFYHRGMFRQEIWTEWAAQMMGENRFKNFSAKEALSLRKAAFGAAPANQLGRVIMDEACLWYEKWIHDTKQSDDSWAQGYWKGFADVAEHVKCPIYFQSGWFDIFSRASMMTYERLPEEIRSESRFVIGPWHHGLLSGGDLEYPDGQKYGVYSAVEILNWFNHMLKRMLYPENKGGIEAYCIGADKWIEYNPAFYETLILYPNAEGQSLSLKTEVGDSKKISWTYDPKKPIASRGGTLIGNHNDPKNLGNPECACWQPNVGYRDDVISFVSDPVEHDFVLTGKMMLDLYVSSDAPATCFSIKVIEERKDGKNVNIREDITDIRWTSSNEIAEYVPNDIRLLHFDIQDISWKVNEGSKIRLDIASSNYPAYHIHPNTTEAWADVIASKKAKQTVYTGKDYPSKLVIGIADYEKDK